MPPRPASGLRILLYHSVAPPVTGDRLGLRLDPALFAAQMERLRAGGRRVIPLEAILEPSGGATPGVAITFDDGYRDTLEAAAPVLSGYGFPATVFLTTGFLDGALPRRAYWDDWPHLGWREARDLARAGFTIGSHAASHVPLPGLPAAQLAAEVRDSRKALEDRLGVAVTAFAYPHGVCDEAAVRAVEDAGYRLACTGLAGTNEPPCDVLRLRRTDVDGRDTLADFARRLEGRHDWLGAWPRRRRG
ncbi:MAG: polysaccharide deacetylase family protein [Candidatus Rokubacteria bacterium]|nr:polysaccharide deacetylase family protein [Candidatus Rokubacteria bacterium]